MEILTNNEGVTFNHGEVFEIDHTVNGYSKFIVMGTAEDFEVFYVNPNMTIGRKYEYDAADLLQTQGIKLIG